MSVAKIIEISCSSPTSMEAAVQTGLDKCSETVKGIQGAWVNDVKVVTDAKGKISEWRINMRVTFLVS